MKKVYDWYILYLLSKVSWCLLDFPPSFFACKIKNHLVNISYEGKSVIPTCQDLRHKEDIRTRLNMILNRAIPRDPRFFNLQDFTTAEDLDEFQVRLLLVKSICVCQKGLFGGSEHWQANIREHWNEYTSEIKGNLFQRWRVRAKVFYETLTWFYTAICVWLALAY